MPNTNAPFGFRQYRGGGSAPTYEIVAMKIASNNTTAIFDGDAVVPLSTGYIAQATAGTVALAGVFNGCKYTSVSQKRTVWSNYWPGSDVASNQTEWDIYSPDLWAWIAKITTKHGFVMESVQPVKEEDGT